MIAFMVWLIVGAFVGWIASIITKSDAEMRGMMNILVGVVGAILAGVILRATSATGSSVNESISFANILVSVLGAVVLLSIASLVRRGKHRHV